MVRVFKGWVVPGPEVPGDPSAPLEDEVSLDCLSGNFRVYQLKKGHRFSTDDLLAAWYGTTLVPSAGRVLDLGSGIGSVGMIAAWRLRGARFVTVEAQARSVELARRSARFNGLEDRYEIRQGDFREPGMIRPDETFDLVLASPPYFPLDAGTLGNHEQKIACRFEVRGDIGDYCRVAAAHLVPGGVFACVFPINPAQQEARVEEGAAAAGLQIIRRRPVALKAGDVPLLSVFGMMRTDHLPPSFQGKGWKEPVLTIREADGTVHPEYSTVKLSIGFPP